MSLNQEVEPLKQTNKEIPMQKSKYTLTLYILDTPKWVLWQTVKDPDEMQNNAAFNKILHYLLRLKQPPGR